VTPLPQKDTPGRHFLTIISIIAVCGAVLELLGWILPRPLHEDVAYITQAVRSLISNGHLASSGFCFPFQALSPEFTGDNPVFAHYLTAIFYYWPFMVIFGASDVVFYGAQALLLIVLLALVSRSGMGWRWGALLVAVSILLHTLVDSICFSPSQLLAIVLAAVFFTFSEKEKGFRADVLGSLLAIACFCRPEAVVVGVYAFLKQVRFQEAARRYSWFIRFGIGFVVMVSCLLLLRKALGGAGSSDNQMVLLMANVVAPGFSVLESATLPTRAEFFQSPSLFKGVLEKIGVHLVELPYRTSVLRHRLDWMMVFVPFLFIAVRPSAWRHYRLAGVLLVAQTLLNAALLPLPRHYDAAFFFLLWAIVKDIQVWWDKSGAMVKRIAGGLGLLWLAYRLWLPVLNSPSLLTSLELRHQALTMSQKVHALVPRDAFVITNRMELWSWYGEGRMSCYLPLSNPETMRLLLQRFPDSYVVLFMDAAYALSFQGMMQRPVLLSAQEGVVVYGPKAAATDPDTAKNKEVEAHRRERRRVEP